MSNREFGDVELSHDLGTRMGRVEARPDTADPSKWAIERIFDITDEHGVDLGEPQDVDFEFAQAHLNQYPVEQEQLSPEEDFENEKIWAAEQELDSFDEDNGIYNGRTIVEDGFELVHGSKSLWRLYSGLKHMLRNYADDGFHDALAEIDEIEEMSSNLIAAIQYHEQQISGSDYNLND